jgi:L-lactate dehydrogenase (cytochrome)
MMDVSARDLGTTIVGETVGLPVVLAPTGLMGVVYPDGELHAAKAAHAYNVPLCLSVLSVCSLEEVAAAVANSVWFQLYLFKDRGVNQDLLRRAQEAKCPVLVLTMDLHMEGRRDRDLINGFTIPPRFSVLRAFLGHPRWAITIKLNSHKTLCTLQKYVAGPPDLTATTQWLARELSVSFNHSDLAWVRQNWPGKLIVKGILDPEDAKIAADLGVDAIVVSNHGGRQLDGAPTPVDVFPKIRDIVGDRVELIFDSGIRSGLDVLKAIGLGARAVFLGRPFLYGLGAFGEAGVRKALEFIADELDVGMALTGTTDLRSVPRDLILGAP